MNQMQLDLHVPASFRQRLQICLTSLHELRQRQQNPVQKMGKSSMHQILEAKPCLYSISVMVRSLQPSQLMRIGNRACRPEVGYSLRSKLAGTFILDMEVRLLISSNRNLLSVRAGSSGRVQRSRSEAKLMDIWDNLLSYYKYYNFYVVCISIIEVGWQIIRVAHPILHFRHMEFKIYICFIIANQY